MTALIAGSLSCRSVTDAVGSDPVLRIGVGVGSSTRDASLSGLTDLLYSESLLTREWDGRLTPRLATAWEWQDDGRTLRLDLKPGVRLHDDTTLTADLVARYLAARLPGKDASPGWGFRSVADVSAQPPNTLVIRLREPDMFLLAALSDLKILHPDRPDVGTGPFRIIARAPTVETRRFENYHAGRSPLGGVKIITYETPRAAWAALMRREVDVVQEVSRESVEFMERGSGIRIYSSIHPFYVPLIFNHRNPILKHAEVRRAINEAIDREDIIQRAMRGRGTAADVPVWPRHWARERPLPPYLFDPAGARARLDRAGFRETAGGGRGDPNIRFALRCLVYNEDPQYERVALMLRRQLFDVGIDLAIELVPFDVLQARMKAGDFDAYIMRANASRTLERTYRSWISSSPADGSTFNSGYTGADALLERLRRSTTDDEIRASVAALTDRFHEDVPAAIIAWIEVTRAVDARFAVGDDTFTDPFFNLWQWSLAEPATQ